MAKTIIGVMGPGEGAANKITEQAKELGRLIAKKGWVLLTGGRNTGVMDAASKGARQADGLTIGILPTENNQEASEYLDIPIRTGMGSARNNINILSSDVVIACGIGAGTTSEIMLAIKSGKPLILLSPSENLLQFLEELPYITPPRAQSAEEAIQFIKKQL